jgi:hypothetical protein
MRVLSGSHIQKARPINAKFGFSHWMKSPSVGLTFPVSYTLCLYNNIMAEFLRKV